METLIIIVVVIAVTAVILIRRKNEADRLSFMRIYLAINRTNIDSLEIADDKITESEEAIINMHRSINFICSTFQNQLQEIIELDNYPSSQTHTINGMVVVNGEPTYKFRPLARFDDDWSVGYIAGLVDGYCLEYNNHSRRESEKYGSGQRELDSTAIMTVVFSRIYGDEDGGKNLKRFLLGNDKINVGMRKGGGEMTSHLLVSGYIPYGWAQHVKEYH